MDRKQREKRDAEIVLLRQQNYSMQEVADKLNITFGVVYHVSHKYGLGGKRSVKKASYNPESGKKLIHTKEQVSNLVRDRLPGFEYVGNYSGTDGSADIQCKQCGTAMTRSMISIRHSSVKCRECERIERVKAEELKRKEAEAREAKRELERKEKKKERFWSQSFNQMSMKQCPVCRALFVGNRKYCSDHCRKQNKWHMKEGYRKLFPLEEVFKRNGGICYLCGKPCDWNDVEVRDGTLIFGNKYPSRDHVIPKSKGGLNEWDNIRLAHRICNSLKSDSPLVEKK